MDLQEIKKALKEANFPKATTEAIENIIGIAEARDGQINEDENREILALIDDAIQKSEEEDAALLDIHDAYQGVQDAFVTATERAAKEQQEKQGNPPTNQ